MGEMVSKRVFWGPIFQFSPMPARAIFRFAVKERIWRVQLHVGLRKGSAGEFSCTQRIPFGALLDGRNALVMRLRRPDFSAISDAF